MLQYYGIFVVFQIVLRRRHPSLGIMLPVTTLNITSRCISTSAPANHIIKLSRLRVVDNSALGRKAMLEGKPPRCIHVYNKIGIGYIGEKIEIKYL